MSVVMSQILVSWPVNVLSRSRVMAIFLGLRCCSGTAMSFYVRVEQTVFVHSVYKKAYLSPLIQTCTGVFSYAEQDQSRH